MGAVVVSVVMMMVLWVWSSVCEIQLYDASEMTFCISLLGSTYPIILDFRKRYSLTCVPALAKLAKLESEVTLLMPFASSRDCGGIFYQ